MARKDNIKRQPSTWGRGVSTSLFAGGGVWSIHAIFGPMLAALFLSAPAPNDRPLWCANQTGLLRSDLSERISIEMAYGRTETRRAERWRSRLQAALRTCTSETDTLLELSAQEQGYEHARPQLQRIKLLLRTTPDKS